MATLSTLKQALREKAAAAVSTPYPSSLQPLSDAQYSAGFNILLQGSEWATYQDFIIPQLSQLLAPLFNSRTGISVLEIGPGPKSVLGYLPSRMRGKIKRYDVFEPNSLYAAALENWLGPPAKTEVPFPCLERTPNIHLVPFVPDGRTGCGIGINTSRDGRKYDVVLFCHSMYGMRPHHEFIKQALKMLDEQQEGGMAVVFHRDEILDLADLVCYRTASFPTGVVSVANDDEAIDLFAAFISRYTVQDVDEAVRAGWREVCRALSRREEAHANHLLFSSPNIMIAFNQHSTALAELIAHVPLVQRDKIVKNQEANLHRPASIIRPLEVQHIQHCVHWALKHRFGLTVIGGGHSGHCLWPNVVSVDMGAFDQVHIVDASEDNGDGASDSGYLIVTGAGCKAGDIIRKTMEAGLTVPLGARPSVGAGLWLQGGFGHLTRLYGLACDAIIGAVMVSVDSGQVLYIGHVPRKHRPIGAVRPEPENEADLLWAIKGAGTNFGIVVSVTFKAHAARTFTTRNWIFPLSDNLEARRRLSSFDKLVARGVPRNCSVDAYLYWNDGRMHLGVTLFESSTSKLTLDTPTPTFESVGAILGPGNSSKVVDGVGLFDTDMYMADMHGGHGGGKTSAFKRCLFLNDIGTKSIADLLLKAIETRPSPLCYLHLLQGGGAVGDVAADAAAFGCRDWEFACVITGVWPRDQNGTETAKATVRWVYKVVADILPLGNGVYGADLGPDPRDAVLSTKAFGPNRPRLARLKRKFDPCRVLAYASPLLKEPNNSKLIILVTGESCAGKDYCAEVWASVFINNTSLAARVASISDATKLEYVAKSGADLNRLFLDRTYKEQHRPALTAFFQDQVRQRPRLPEEHFLNVVYGAEDADVLLITGMREEAPVAAMAHLVPDSKLLEVRVEVSEKTRQARGGNQGNGDDGKDGYNGMSDSTDLNHRPDLTFNNNTSGNEAAKWFAENYLLLYVHEDLRRLADMVRLVPDFPRQSIQFRDVLGISQQPGGLALCASLLQTQFTGDWAKISAIATCEAGGFIYASALASQVNPPLALIREAGKLPPPIISVAKSSSYISSAASAASNNSKNEKRIVMGRGVIPKGASVVVVDDVLATGETLCAVLQLLDKAGIRAEDVNIMVVAEFPVHRGREMLRQCGFGRVNIQSLLVYDGT